MKITRTVLFPVLFIFTFFLLAGCSEDEAPERENEEESITRATLNFMPTGGGNPLVFSWVDPDGDGPQQPVIDPIVLAANTEYNLTIELAGPNNENLTQEIQLEADEHLFFFGWTDELFSSPTGTGNISSRSGVVDYNDTDRNNLPLGLSTNWTTAGPATGTFTTILKHQPDIKSETSTATDGETDLQIQWNATVQ